MSTTIDTVVLLVTAVLQAWTARELRSLRNVAEDHRQQDSDRADHLF